MPKPAPAVVAHLEWLGFVRPTGLVVSAPALARHGATLNRNDAEGQRRLRDCVAEQPINGDTTPVFLLYAEERDMLPQDETYLSAYSLAGLHQRLREDAALHPDTMDQPYCAYAQLLALFRMVHDGARSGAMKLPPRHGALFAPERYRFAERPRPLDRRHPADERLRRSALGERRNHLPREFIVLEKLDGERISYAPWTWSNASFGLDTKQAIDEAAA